LCIKTFSMIWTHQIPTVPATLTYTTNLIDLNKIIENINIIYIFSEFRSHDNMILFSAHPASLILISEEFLGVGKVTGWTPPRMQGSDYRFNFSVWRRRLRVCDIIHSDKVSHLHRFSAVTVIHTGCSHEQVLALSYPWIAEGNRRTARCMAYLMTLWPLMKWYNNLD